MSCAVAALRIDDQSLADLVGQAEVAVDQGVLVAVVAGDGAGEVVVADQIEVEAVGAHAAEGRETVGQVDRVHGGQRDTVLTLPVLVLAAAGGAAAGQGGQVGHRRAVRRREAVGVVGADAGGALAVGGRAVGDAVIARDTLWSVYSAPKMNSFFMPPSVVSTRRLLWWAK